MHFFKIDSKLIKEKNKMLKDCYCFKDIKNDVDAIEARIQLVERREEKRYFITEL